MNFFLPETKVSGQIKVSSPNEPFLGLDLGPDDAETQQRYSQKALDLFSEDEQLDPNYVFIPPLFAQIYLPHKACKGNTWTVENQNYSFTIISSNRRELPYGCFPRLLLSYICTEIIRKDSPEIDLGKNKTQMMAKLGFKLSGRNSELFSRAALDLFGSQMEICVKGPNAKKSIKTPLEELEGNYFFFNIARSFILWGSSPEDEGSRRSWIEKLTVNESFFEYVRKTRGIPINYTHLSSFTKSSLAMDLYVWLLYRFFILQNSSVSDLCLDFNTLRHQFQPNSTQKLYHFKAKFLNCMNMVLPFLPEFKDNVKLSDDGKAFILTKPTKELSVYLKKRFEEK